MNNSNATKDKKKNYNKLRRNYVFLSFKQLQPFLIMVSLELVWLAMPSYSKILECVSITAKKKQLLKL